METPDKISLGRIIDGIGDGHYVIPDFQREFEWHPWDVVELIKSIFKDYYVGTLLLWKADKENIKALSCESIDGFPKDRLKPRHIVLDGQQRLSALHHVFFAPNINYRKRSNRCFFFIDLEKLLDKNIEEAIYYDWGTKKTMNIVNNKEVQFAKKIFPLKVLSEKKDDFHEWLEGYKVYWLRNGNKEIESERQELKKEFNDILHEYEISYIELDRNIEIAKVCDIFTKINSTGVPLSIFDLLNAVLKPKEIQLKKEWRKVAENFSGVIEAKSVLQTMSILKQNYCAPSYLYYLVPGEKKTIKCPDGTFEKVVLIKEKQEFIDLWDFVVINMRKTLQSIRNARDFGAIIPRFIPYPVMIPIITALNIEKEKDIYEDKQNIKKKIKTWYWASIFTRNYSSSAESQMAKDHLELKKWFNNDDEEPNVVIQIKREIGNLNLEHEKTQSSAIYKAIFNLLIMKGAKDWDSYELPEYANLHDHRIVPYSWGKRNIKNINTVLNRTPLSDATNCNVIGSQLPNVYIKKMFDKAKNKEEVYKLFKTHLISETAIEILLRPNFTKKDFEEFICEREKTILKEIKKLVNDLTSMEENFADNLDKPLNNIEEKLRTFINKEFTRKFNKDYWKKIIPSHMQDIIGKRINDYLKKNPDKTMSDLTDRDKLNYCDVMDYFTLFTGNWSLFEENFVSKYELEKKFNNFKTYRDAIKHNKPMSSVMRKEGEAALEWLDKIIK